MLRRCSRFSRRRPRCSLRKGGRSLAVSLGVTFAFVCGLTGTAVAAVGDLSLVSRADGALGAQSNGSSYEPSISGDGRYIVFSSNATNLGGHTDGTRDIVWRDALLGTTKIVSRASGAGGALANDTSLAPVISANGRFVAFTSLATNLTVDADGNTGSPDVYLRDLQTNETELVSRASGAAGAPADGAASEPAISGDGRFVVFGSGSSNLGGHTDGVWDVLLRDRQEHTTSVVNRASGADGALMDGARGGLISADGSLLVFRASMTNPGGGTTGQVFARTRESAATELVSRSSGAAGATGDKASDQPAVSLDGRFVAFESFATNLVSGDANAHRDVFVRDRATGGVALVSRAAGAAGALGNADSDTTFKPSMQGCRIAFQSLATNLVPDDTTTGYDVFLRDLVTQQVELASRSSGASGVLGLGDSKFTALSASGQWLAFETFAANLIPGDLGPAGDVVVRELSVPTGTCSVPPDGGPGGGNPGGGNPGGGNPGGGNPGGGNPGGSTPLPPLDPAKSFVLPSSKKCVSRRSFRIRVRKIPSVTWVSATIKVNGKRVDTVKGKRLTAAISLKKLPAGRFTVKITAKASDGRTVTGTRRYRTCAKKLRSRGPKL